MNVGELGYQPNEEFSAFHSEATPFLDRARAYLAEAADHGAFNLGS